MNEFIVWDKLKEQFITERIAVGINGVVIVFKDGKVRDFLIPEKFSIHNYIGKTDDTPENNKIYADCSIVEFEYGNIKNKLIGVFTFNIDELRYEIDIYNNTSYSCLNYDFEDMQNFKVIGTLQQNKHLLKDKK